MGHLIRHDDFIKNIVEGKVEEKRGRGRPRYSYIKQIKEKVKVTYKEDQESALDKRKWKELHRQELGS